MASNPSNESTKTNKTTKPTIKFSEKQKRAFQQCNKRINILEGAVRSGKTFIGFYIWLKYIFTAPEGDLLMAGKTLSTLERNVLKAKGGIFDLLGEGNYRYLKNQGILYTAGRTIYCIGANDEKSENKIRGMTIAGKLI
jgi:hypothetical protein